MWDVFKEILRADTPDIKAEAIHVLQKDVGDTRQYYHEKVKDT